MRNPRVASRYAKALISLSEERNELDAIKNDADVVLKALKESREFRAFLLSPVVQPLTKKAILKEVFEKNVSALAMSFLELLVTQKREEFTQEILENFIKQYLDVKNIVKASVSTAMPIDDELRAEFKQLIKAKTNKEVLIEEHVNPDLIGGFVVRFGDLEFDSSISGKLKRLSREFEENPYVAAI